MLKLEDRQPSYSENENYEPLRAKVIQTFFQGNIKKLILIPKMTAFVKL